VYSALVQLCTVRSNECVKVQSTVTSNMEVTVFLVMTLSILALNMSSSL